MIPRSVFVRLLVLMLMLNDGWRMRGRSDRRWGLLA